MNRQGEQTAWSPSSIDRETYGHAYERGYGLTKGFLLSKGISREDAEDVAQSAWLRGWERRDDLRCPERLLNWINSIALNDLRQRFRGERLEFGLTEAPQTREDRGFLTIDVARRLSRCKPSDSKLLRQHYAEGYSCAELARLWRCRPSTIRVRLLRARRGLARSLAPALRSTRAEVINRSARRSNRRRPKPHEGAIR